jgi:sister chromatid cohesion protein DCC1
VNLCTPDKTFRIRQVQSSNSIHLVQPSKGENSQLVPLKQQPEENNGDEDGWTDTISAIAKCASTLEVHGVEEGSATSVVTQALTTNLRVYEADREDVDMADASQPEGLVVTRAERESIKRKVLADVPFSDAECDAAWTDVCAFVHVDMENKQNIVGFRPSARMKIDAWKRILEGSVLQSIDLEKQFLANDLWKAVLGDDYDDEKEPFPRPLFDALLNRLVERSDSQPLELKCTIQISNISFWLG